MQKKLLSILSALLLAIGALTTASAWAATATANLTVSVDVDEMCTIATNPVTFSTYQPIGVHATSPDDSTGGSVVVTCTAGTNASVTLDRGQNASGDQARMSDGAGSFLSYTIYVDAQRTVVWNTVTLGPAPDTSPRTFNTYARIPAGQTPSLDTHTDTVLATVSF